MPLPANKMMLFRDHSDISTFAFQIRLGIFDPL